MTRKEEFQRYLDQIIKPAFKTNEHNVPGLDKVVIWITGINEEKGIVKLGLALQEGLGCSPFCGCAAGQIASAIQAHAMQDLPWVTRVIGIAAMPPSTAGEPEEKEENA